MDRSARVMSSILDRIMEGKRAEAAALRPRAAELRRAAEAASPPRDFAAALRAGPCAGVIAEFKRRSPSAGWIGEGADPGDVARAYEGAGAAAMSVLTDGRWFGGSLDDLVRARDAVDLPLLRKDFVVEEAQLWEARAAGADAALLIVRVLEPARLRDLLAACGAVGLAALVEVHGAGELDVALSAGATVIGVNNRDLSTFETDLSRTLELAPSVPADAVLVAESGIRTAADVARLVEGGTDAVLVGESLMRGGAASELASVPRRARAGR